MRRSPIAHAAAVTLAITAATTATARAGAIDRDGLQRDLDRLTQGFDGRVGVCVRDASGSTAHTNGDRRFSLQSVMKLVVATATLDAVDAGTMRLDDPVTVRREDLSLYVQPIAKLVAGQGEFHTTVGDLVRRAVVDSDSAAVDILIRRLGGTDRVQAFLNRKNIAGVRIDRDERHLQTEIEGIEWRPEFVDRDTLNRAIAAVPDDRRDAAYRAYQADPRDTATPDGMADLLHALAAGRLLSPVSTRYLTDVMAATVTFPDRLKAGVPAGWQLGHKTGSSGSRRGVTAATNDVGILTAPDGGHVSVVVFIADSPAPPEARAALMAQVARAVTTHYR